MSQQTIVQAFAENRIGDIKISREMLNTAFDDFYRLIFASVRVLGVEYGFDESVRYRIAHPYFRAIREGEAIPMYDALISVTTSGDGHERQYAIQYKEHPRIKVRPL